MLFIKLKCYMNKTKLTWTNKVSEPTLHRYPIAPLKMFPKEMLEKFTV